jgi:hypothetical protein
MRRLTPRPNRRALGRSIAAVAVLSLSCAAASAQTVEDVFCMEPADGARVGVKPRFRVGLRGSDSMKVRYRIELSRDDFDTIAYTIDQTVEPGGWAFIDPGFDVPGAMFLTSKPLEDGDYEWRPAAWNGTDWVKSKIAYRLSIDGIPPADVDGVEMKVADDGAVVLDWKPVALDRDGHPEYVTRYHVYRYQTRSMFFVIRPFRIATVDTTHFVDRDPLALATPLIFYKITAEDESGNEPERRY